MKIYYRIIDRKIITIALVTGITGFIIGQITASRPIKKALNNLESNQQETNELRPPVMVAEEYYICPMHPEVISNSPGTCPICGMNLVKHTHLSGQLLSPLISDYPAIRIQPTVVHNLGIKTAKVITGNLKHNIETIAKITRIDLTARRILTPPMAGTITYITDKDDGDEISAGELLYSISSEDLYAKQREFQSLSMAGDRKATMMIPQLIHSGLTKQQISRLQAGEATEFTIDIYAKEPGYIFSKRGKSGEYIPSGYTVFNIGSDYRVVEVTAEIFERQWNWVKKGQQASMTVRGLPGIVFTGKVVRVEPPVGYTTRSLEVALKFKTDHPGLTQSTFAHVSIMGKVKHHVLLVPRNAVIQTAQGARVVIVHNDGSYQPVNVTIGEQSEDQVEILSGLKEGDTIVSSGQFLIDSESNLQSALKRMTPAHKNHSPNQPK